MKLSAAQKNVIKLMREGWEIRHDWVLNHVWLHGKYPAKPFATKTFKVLQDQGIIMKRLSQIESQTPHRYRLTALGESVNID